MSLADIELTIAHIDALLAQPDIAQYDKPRPAKAEAPQPEQPAPVLIEDEVLAFNAIVRESLARDGVELPPTTPDVPPDTLVA